jgi:hypothetical protein
MSQHGLLTTVAYQLGLHKPVTFALEGAVSMAGQSVRWLKDNLKFFKEAKDVGEKEKFNTLLILSVEKYSNKKSTLVRLKTLVVCTLYLRSLVS